MGEKKAANTVTIVGLNYGSILTMVRDLGEAGYDVKVVRVFKKKPNPVNLLGNMKPEKHSIYVKDHRIAVMSEGEDALLDLLMEMGDPDDRSLLIPVDDFLVSYIDDSYDILSECYVISSVSQKRNGINRLMDKHLQKELAENAGLKVPKSVLIEMKDGECRIPDDVPFPCFLKPNMSTRGSKLIMKRYDDRYELWEAMNRYSGGGDLSLLAEEYIDIKAEYSLLGMSIPDLTAAPFIFRAMLPGHRERKGVAVTGIILDPDDYRDVIDKAEVFVSMTGYTGMFDIDLIEDQYGNIYFTELNLRAGASVHAFSGGGFSIPAAFAGYMLKGQVPEIEYRAEKGKTFVSEKALLEEYVRSDIDRNIFLRNMTGHQLTFIDDTKDPEPFRVFRRYAKIVPALRLPYGIRDKALKR